MSKRSVVRQAATLIIAAKTFGDHSCQLRTSTSSESVHAHGYRFLGLQRSKDTPFMPNAYVFPGGTVDGADFSAKWLEIFQLRGASNWISDLALLKARTAEPRPPTLLPSTYSSAKFMSSVADNGDVLLPEAALRLTAIRETFEECGILLARPNASGTSSDVPTVTLESRLGGERSVVEWQERIQKDPQQFMDLCHRLDCCPDVWSLHEWSDWLTPSTMSRRFDSLFFICELNYQPTITCSTYEIQDYQWSTPEQFIDLFRQKRLIIPPPQIYELNRLRNMIETGYLQNFFTKSTHPAIPCQLPVRATAKDGIVFLLPGDDLYPENISSRELNFDLTVDELNSSAKFLNRSCFTDSNDAMLLVKLNGKDNEFQFSCKL